MSDEMREHGRAAMKRRRASRVARTCSGMADSVPACAAPPPIKLQQALRAHREREDEPRISAIALDDVAFQGNVSTSMTTGAEAARDE